MKKKIKKIPEEEQAEREMVGGDVNRGKELNP